MRPDPDVVARVEEFHGHRCPGLAMGIQAALLALREVGPSAVDEEVLAITETDMCGVDAIQVLTGCTFGKGNLEHRDWGKTAFTFIRRADQRAVRVAARPDAWPDRAMAREKRIDAILAADPEDLFTVTTVTVRPPPTARVHTSVPCAQCQEMVMETRVRQFEARTLCQPCFDAALDG